MKLNVVEGRFPG